MASDTVRPSEWDEAKEAVAIAALMYVQALDAGQARKAAMLLRRLQDATRVLAEAGKREMMV